MKCKFSDCYGYLSISLSKVAEEFLPTIGLNISLSKVA